MLQPLTVVLLVASGVLGLMAAHHLLRGRLVDDPVIIVGAAIELALLVQLVVGLTKASAIGDGAERATFIAYLFTVLLVIPATIVIALTQDPKEPQSP